MSKSTINNQVKEFYAQDVVYRFDQHNNNKIMFGVVLDSYDSFDSDENQRIKKGQIIVLWHKRTRKQLCKQYKVNLLSRNIIPGDIVRRLVDGKETQRGYCKFTEQWITVRILNTNKIIENVPDSRLYCFKQFEIGDAVCLGEKFGRIISIDYIMKMQSKCGSIVEINTSINIDIKHIWDAQLKFGRDCPGQIVTCIPSLLNDPRWLKKTKTMNRRISTLQTFTIQTITPYIIEVWWYNPNGRTEYAELQEDDIKKLKVLPSTDFISWGNRLIMQLQQNDVLLKYKNWLKKMSILYQPDHQQVPQNNQQQINNNDNTNNDNDNNDNNDDTDDEEEDDDDDGENKGEQSWHSVEDDNDSFDNINSEDNKLIKRMNKVKLTKLLTKKTQYKPKCTPGSLVAVEVINIDSKSTIVWQDGTQEKNIPTKELYFSVSLDDHEFFPGEWVVLNINDNNEKYGVIQRVDFAERTAEVKWFIYSKELQKPEQIESTPQISVYELKKHPVYVFRPGSVVRRKPIQADLMGKIIDSCPDGYIKVQWMNGTIEHCWPQDIEVLPDNEMFEYDDDDDDDDDNLTIESLSNLSNNHNSDSSDDDDNDDQLSWTTESTESFNGDVTDDIILENMATKVIFIKERLSNLRELLRNFTINKNFNIVKNLLLIYENSSYLDKYLGTSFFSLESKHFQVLLSETKKRAKSLGIELRGRLFSSDHLKIYNKTKDPEIDNIQKILKLENKINQQIENNACESTLATPDSVKTFEKTEDDLCVELLLMLIMRFDLVYAEIVSRMGSRDALCVLKNTTERPLLASSSQTAISKQQLSSNILQKLNMLTSIDNDKKSVSTPIETDKKLIVQSDIDGFIMVEEAPLYHHYYSTKFHPKDLQKFLTILKKEYRLLKESLPSGICIKAYTDRIDLLSLMIIGPSKTPYEDGVFLFDIQLKSDYPSSPPSVHYISYIQEQLNPNLYVEGKVCVSLLGTWIGRGNEVWGPNSTLLQLIVSIQGLILVAQPYFNEAGYDKQLNTQQGIENSRTYNEFVLLKLVQSMIELLKNPPKIFHNEILKHFERNGMKMYERLNNFLSIEQPLIPEFPLQPVSKGLQLSLRTALEDFKEILMRTLENTQK